MIVIRRIEKEMITNREKPLDEQSFDNRDDAFRFLTEHVSQITPAQMDEIMNHPVTSFEAFGMISAGDAAYSAQIIYEIEVS